MGVYDVEEARNYMFKLLTVMADAGGSDLFIAKDFPPSMKLNGKMVPLTEQRLPGEVRASKILPSFRPITTVVEPPVSAASSPISSFSSGNCIN